MPVSLQGFVPMTYRRGVRKGEYELWFNKTGFFYRPWWRLDEKDEKPVLVDDFDHSGESVSRYDHPDHGFSDLIKSKKRPLSPERFGPPKARGFYELRSRIVGPMLTVKAKKDRDTQILMSWPTRDETEIVCIAEWDDVTGEKDEDGKDIPVLEKEFDIYTTIPTARKLTVKKGEEYFYVLYGIEPEEWRLFGPFDRKTTAVDPMTAARRLAHKLTEEEMTSIESIRTGDMAVGQHAPNLS